MLYKRDRSPFWWVRITDPNGKEIRRSTKTKDRGLAEECHAKLVQDLFRVARLGEKPRHTWQEAVLRWSEEKSTKRSFMDDIHHFRLLSVLLRDKYLDEITGDVVKQIREQRKSGVLGAALHKLENPTPHPKQPSRFKTDVTPASCNRTLALLRAVLKRAAGEWEWLERAPTVTLFPEPNLRVRWLTREEADRLIAELPPHLADMAAFTLATGLRAKNVTGLRWSEVNMERRVAWVHPDESKNAQALGVPLNKDAVLILRRWLGKHPTHVFHYRLNPIRATNTRAWYQALKRAGIENFRWHDLRHTWASYHVQAGTPLHILQEMGGWSSFAMVRKYAHLAPEHLHDHADRIASQLQAVPAANIRKG